MNRQRDVDDPVAVSVASKVPRAPTGSTSWMGESMVSTSVMEMMQDPAVMPEAEPSGDIAETMSTRKSAE